MGFTNIMGGIATVFALLIHAGVIIQIQRIRKRRSSSDLSLPMFFFVQCACLSWFLYGCSIESIFLMVGQGVGFIVVSILLYFVLKYRNGEDENPTESKTS
jgi:uncharacterized protein with PQ loop repeat